MLEEKILNTINKFELISAGDKVVIGVSGGPDSMCLLHFFITIKEKYNLKLYVAHINHGIREESTEEEQFVENFCKKNEIECFIKHANIPEIAKKEKRGLEETGRMVRYSFFDEVLNKVNANKIAIAHNLNDYAETILMNVLRGSGLNGLKGIDPKNGYYIRPLINCNREEIEKYCEEEKLNPRFDKSNNDNTYTRNKIRNIVIPYIKEEFNPNFIDTLYRLSEISKEENDFIEKIVVQTYSEIVELEENEKIILNLKKFNNLELVIKRRLILYTVYKLFGTSQGIEKIHIEDIIKLCSNNIGNKYLKPNKKIKVSIKNKKIIFEAEKQ